MKKLLSILTISALTASVTAPLLANTSLTRIKRGVGVYNSKNEYLPIKEFINIRGDIYKMAIDTKDNIYFGKFQKGAFVLKRGETTPTKINGIRNNIQSITIDSKGNIYFGTSEGAYKLSAGSTTPTKINGITDRVNAIAVDSKDNIYFGTDKDAYKLSAGSTTPTKINGITDIVNAIAVDSKDNIYFGKFQKGAFVLKRGETTPTKINGIRNNIQSITIDSKGNIYFGMYQDGAFVLKHSEKTANNIDGIETIRSISDIKFDTNNNIYFGTDNGAFVLKQGEKTPTKINGISNNIQSITIDSKGNIYFGTSKGTNILQTALSWIKQQSKFSLVDDTKTQTWTSPDLISVDGELNIEITNPNIDKVVFDSVQQPQTNKQWEINVKPETAPRDHILQVLFTLDGKQYTSQITVSMQAKIDPTPTQVQQNLSDLIKTIDLGNIIDNNYDTIFAAVNQKNGNVIDDFSQIEISKKDNYSSTLTAKSDSKSYKGSVDVTYNVVPATAVDLKIDVTPTSSKAIVVKDYLGQIDKSSTTNQVNTFYYANSESKITLVKSTESSVITGVVYGCDGRWNKTSQASNIDPSSGIKLDGSQLNTKDGKYVVELSDNLGHTNNVYLQINKEKKDIKEYWNTPNGKQFEQRAEDNGYKNIRGSSARHLNKLFADSKNWQQIASDNQFANALAEWFKTNDKPSSKEPLTAERVEEQLKTQIPNSITIDGVNTSNYDVNKVSFELNQSQVNPNDKVNIVVKYNNATSEQFTLQIKDSNAPDKKTKSGLSGEAIVGIVVGSLLGLFILGWLFKKFVVTPFILEPIRKKKAKAFAEKTAKDIAQMKLDDEEWEAKQKGGK